MITDEKIDEIVKASKMLGEKVRYLTVFSDGGYAKNVEEMYNYVVSGIYYQVQHIDRPVTHEEVREMFEVFFRERRCYNLNARRTLKRLGIPYEIKEGKWHCSGGFWKKPKYVRCLTLDDEQKYEAERRKLLANNIRRRRRERQRRQEQEVELKTRAN
jgi:hypothetical protein